MNYYQKKQRGVKMRNDFSRGKCPVCGCDVMFRQNKNRILYCYCRNGHHAKLNRDDSVVANAKIAAGQNWNNGIVYLYPILKGKTENETENRTNTGNATGTTGSNTTGNATGTTGTDSARAGIFKSDSENKRTVAGTSGGSSAAGTTGNDSDIFGWL